MSSMLRRHPIFQAGLILLIIRGAGLIHRYLLLKGGTILSRLDLFWPIFLYTCGVIFLIVGIFLTAWKILRRGRVWATLVACLTFLFLMVLGQVDLTVSGIIGQPFSPTMFRTYRGPELLISPEFLEPVREHALQISVALIIGLAVLFWILFIFRKWGRRPDETQISWLAPAAVLLIAGFLLMVPPRIGWGSFDRPVEITFLREYLGMDDVRISIPEKEAKAAIRAFVGLPEGCRWLSDKFPLVYGPVKDPGPLPNQSENRPDIVIILAESLKAGHLGFIKQLPRSSPTPILDEWAARSVVFPYYISNGFPTGPAFICLHASAWPHYNKEIATDFPGRHLDSLPVRLRTLGYETLFVGGNLGFDKQDILAAKWYDIVVDEQRTDKLVVSEAISAISKRDIHTEKRPMFTVIATRSLHYPFRIPPDYDGPLPSSTDGSLRERYDCVLRYCDLQMDRLLSFLMKRKMGQNTVIVFTGDHAIYTDLKKTSGLPENDNVWTSAFIYGPERLVGPPRRIYEAASHVDIMPTVLSLVGDRRPTASMGRDLFWGRRNRPARALAVRPGGIRLLPIRRN